MLKKTFCGILLLTASVAVANEGEGLNEEQRIAQTFGHLISKNLETPGLTLDTEQVIQGIRDGASGKESPMTESEYETAMAAIHEKAFNTLANENLNKAESFLSENASKEGISEIQAGKLQYEVLNAGEGAEVAEHGAPTIHYVGTYSDGTIFGSSEDGSGPVTIPLDQTIEGFNKGIVGMKVGEKRRLYIHPELGYGTGGHLPPNSLLIFDVEVVSADAAKQVEEPVAEGATEAIEENVAEVSEASEEAVR